MSAKSINIPTYPVSEGGKFVGTVSINRVFGLSHGDQEKTRVSDIVDHRNVSLTVNANAQMALTMLLQNGAPLILVFNEADPQKLLEVVTQAEIHQVYESFEQGEFREV